MICFHSPRHRLRDPATELAGGQLVTPYESPRRVDIILEALADAAMEVREPPDSGLDPVLRVHDSNYVEFLRTAWRDWQAMGFEGEALPTVWPSRRMPCLRIPDNIEGRIGYYALASETSISGGSYEAALAAVDVAVAAANALQAGIGAAFALCRPPGHHAAADMYGGYCFFNNAAIAAEGLRAGGAARVAIIDVDFHHGNGTQSIFYARDDVLFASLHGDPSDAFPHFLGYADERGEGAGKGFNHNFPLPRGTAWGAWAAALDEALAAVTAFAPDALVVSLGVDTFENDPISFFRLANADYLRLGERLGQVRLPTVFVMEGGYAVEDIGRNTVNVLRGFEGGG